MITNRDAKQTSVSPMCTGVFPNPALRLTMERMVHVFAKATSKPGCEHQLRSILEKLVQASRAEAGVLTYELFQTIESGEFLFREEYTDQDSFERHRNSRHVLVAVARAQPFMAEPLSLWVVEPVTTGIEA